MKYGTFVVVHDEAGMNSRITNGPEQEGQEARLRDLIAGRRLFLYPGSRYTRAAG
jgi:hypothetical protein